MARQFRSDDTSLWTDRFGSGKDGSPSINSQTDTAPNSSFTGTAGAFAFGIGSISGWNNNDLCIIHQSQGSGAGNWELNRIASTGSQLMAYPLQNNYGTGAQIYLLRQYANVTINSGQTFSGRTWNGTAGIIAIVANQSISITGNIVNTGAGFAGSQVPGSNPGNQGEGTPGLGSQSTALNGNAGGGGGNSADGGGGGGNAAGAGGGSGAAGGQAGAVAGTVGLTNAVFGGGGGSGGTTPGNSGFGGRGGGFLLLIAPIITVTGSIANNGVAGSNGANNGGSGGGGGGGSILLKGQIITLGSSLIVATGGTGGAAVGGGAAGGSGGLGRIHADYLVAPTGTTSPAQDIRFDSVLASPSPIIALF